MGLFGPTISEKVKAAIERSQPQPGRVGSVSYMQPGQAGAVSFQEGGQPVSGTVSYSAQAIPPSLRFEDKPGYVRDEARGTIYHVSSREGQALLRDYYARQAMPVAPEPEPTPQPAPPVVAVAPKPTVQKPVIKLAPVQPKLTRAIDVRKTVQPQEAGFTVRYVSPAEGEDRTEYYMGRRYPEQELGAERIQAATMQNLAMAATLGSSLAIGVGGVGAYTVGGLAGLAGYGTQIGGGVVAAEATRTYSPAVLKKIAPGKEEWRYRAGGEALGAAGFVAGMKVTGVGIKGAKALAQYATTPKTQVLKTTILTDSGIKVIDLRETGGVWQKPTPKYKPFDLTKLKAEKLAVIEDTQRLRQAMRPTVALAKYPKLPTVAEKKAEKLARIEQAQIFYGMERDTSIWTPRPLAKYSELRKAFEAQKKQARIVKAGRGTVAIQIERSFLTPGSYAQLAKTLPRVKPIIEEAQAFKPVVSERMAFAEFTKPKSIFKTPGKTVLETGFAKDVAKARGPKLKNYVGVLAPTARAAFAFKPRFEQKALERQARRLAVAIAPKQRTLVRQRRKAIEKQKRQETLISRIGLQADITQKQAEQTRQDLRTLPLQKTFLKTFIREQTRTRQREKLREKTKTRTKTRTRTRTWLDTPQLQAVSSQNMKSYAEGFTALIRRKGKWLPATPFPVTRETAQAFGAKAALSTLARSYQIVPVGKPARAARRPRLPTGFQTMFRPAKREPGVMVEKAMFALDMPTETKEIQWFAQLAGFGKPRKRR